MTPSHRASLRWPRSSTFPRPKKERVLKSSWTGLDSARERFRGSRFEFYGTTSHWLHEAATKTSLGFKSHTEMVFQKNFGVSRHSGMSFKLKEREIRLI